MTIEYLTTELEESKKEIPEIEICLKTCWTNHCKDRLAKESEKVVKLQTMLAWLHEG